jgi:hypothetical protein
MTNTVFLTGMAGGTGASQSVIILFGFIFVLNIFIAAIVAGYPVK